MNIGGNPVLDRQPSDDEYNKFYLPILTNQGFIRINNSNKSMYNPINNTLLIINAAPSQHQAIDTLNGKISKYKKKYGKDVKTYGIFTRDPNTWPPASKNEYNKNYEKVRRNKNILGISVGLSGLQKNINDINMGNKLY